MEDLRDSPDPAERRKARLKDWLKDKYNLGLLLVLVFAFVIRVRYFLLTRTQTLWWDEAGYMAAAKHWAFGVPFQLEVQRPPLFQFLAALEFMAGFGEVFIKFSLIFLPSVFLVFVVYLLGKELFDKKVGLIAAFLTAVSWTFLFWSSRFQPDFLSMTFQVLAIVFMWKYWKKPKTKPIIYAGIFAAFGFYFKVSALLVPMIFIVFILAKDRFSALKNKHYYYFSIAFLLTLVPYFLWTKVVFGTFLAFSSGYSSTIIESIPFGWYTLNFFYSFTEGVLFVLFLGGLFLSLRFLLYIDLLVKDKSKMLDPNIFSLLVLIFISAFYIFAMKGAEDRWLFLWLPFIFLLIGNALTFVYRKIRVYGKNLAIIIVLGLLLFGAYSQFNHADQIIKNKLGSYEPVELSGVWMKENSVPGDIVLSRSRTQHTYYTERETFSYNLLDGPDELDAYIGENKPKFFVVSVFERHPEWTNLWVDENQGRLQPVKVYFADAQQTNAVLIVYEIKYNALQSAVSTPLV